MQNKNKKRIEITTRVSGYHCSTMNSNANVLDYAFAGFKVNNYFTSDRKVGLDGNFKRLDNKELKGFGIELEVESFQLLNQTAIALAMRQSLAHFDDDLFKFERDGSLNNGVECISQIMTKEFIRNNYPSFKYMFEVMDIFGISASRTGNCGMHVNISKACFGSEEAIRKFVFLVNKKFDFFCKMLKRDTSKITFCGEMSFFRDIENAKNGLLNQYRSSHYYCLNLGHDNRIELRLVGGQKDFPSFRETMEVIFYTIDKVKKSSWNDLVNFKCEKFFDGCNKYVHQRLLEVYPTSINIEVNADDFDF